jgi:single-stranded DNA-binding protein
MATNNQPTKGETKLMIVGFLPRVPEFRTNKRGGEYALFSVGVSKEITSRGETKVVSDYHRVMATGKAVPVLKGANKGAVVKLGGHLDTYKPEGEQYYRTSITITQAEILENRRTREEPVEVVDTDEDDEFEIFDEEDKFF